ncbi:MAG: aminopeptidase P N-terminal domain-containing protein [Planctomycetota bacterium]
MVALEPQAEVYARRRERLMAKLGDGLLILWTAPQTLRNGDVYHEFRPGSDFAYLTGFPEPEAALAVQRRRGELQTWLFVLPRDPEREIWDGKRFGTQGAKRRFGVDAAYPIQELWKQLATLLPGEQRVFHALGRDPERDAQLLRACHRTALSARRSNPAAHPAFEDPTPVLADLRAIKDAAEIDALTRAAEISVAGHVAAMRAARPGAVEYEVQAELEREFRRGGSPRNGYPSIVASGPNACILHYHENDRKMRGGDLLLLDAGAEFGGYTADITRTYPVSGAFTPPQAAVYRAVLKAQKAAIRAAKPGASCEAPHRASQRALTRALINLGVLRGKPQALLREAAFRPWFMHGTSHWLGRDVHDVGAYRQAGKPVKLAAGMVLTVEPGLYFDVRDTRVPKELRGIGVRIEDDVLVTRSGPRVLTEAAPKELRDVERACAY